MFGKVVALDIGSHNLKALFAYAQFHSVKLEKGVLFERHAGENDEELLTRFSQSYSVEQYLPLYFYPSTQLQFRMLSLPFSTAKEIKAVLKSELESILPNTSEGILSDFSFINKGEKQEPSQLLTASVPRPLLENDLALWQSLNMSPGYVGVDGFAALSLLLAQNQIQPDEEIIYLDLGYSHTLFARISGATLVNLRAIPIGARDFNQIIMEEMELNPSSADQMRLTLDQYLWEKPPSGSKVYADLNLTVAQARRITQKEREMMGELLREIRLSIMSKNREDSGPIHDPKRILASGGFLRQGATTRLISQSLGLPLFPVETNLPEDIHLEGNTSSQEFFLPYGLLLSLSHSGGQRINLLQEEYAKLSQATQAQSFKAPLWLGAAALIIFILSLNINAWINKKRTNELEQKLRLRVQKHFPGVSPKSNPVRAVRSKLVLMKQQGTGDKLGVALKVKSLDIISQLAQRTKQFQGLQLKEIRFSGEQVKLEGTAPSYSIIDNIEKKVGSHSLFQKVSISNTRQNIRDKGISFVLTAKL